jgi:dephospho-CoA kinase
MQKIKIIGIAGTDGSGKDTIGELLAEKYGWLFISVSEMLREEARLRGIPLKRNTLKIISAEWRRQYGLGVLVDKALEKYKKVNQKYPGLVVSPMRNPGEAQRLKDLGGLLVWVDADPNVRYNRIINRKKGTEDQVTFEEFVNEEKAQMEHEGDEATLSLSGVKAKADIFLDNSSQNLRTFKIQVQKALKLP